MEEVDFSEEGVKKFKRLLDYFKQLAGDGINSLIEKSLLPMLEHSIPFFSHLVLEDIFDELERLTINRNVVGSNKRIYEIQYLKYPPAEKVTRYGRCNLPNQTVLYACFNTLTALSEMKPQLGDLITKSKWRVKGDQSLKYVPIFKNQPPQRSSITNRIPDIHELIANRQPTMNVNTWKINNLYEEKLKEMPPYLKEQVDALVSFVADGFTKKVSPNSHLDYLFSAYFSDVILNKFESGSIEAIYYPSVQQSLSFENIAIKPTVFDKKYELIEVSDSVVVTTPRIGRDGGYFMEGLGDCKTFDYASGKILWNPDQVRQTDQRMDELKRHYGVEIK